MALLSCGYLITSLQTRNSKHWGLSVPESPPLLGGPLSVWVSFAFHCCHDLAFQNLHLPNWIPPRSQSGPRSVHPTHKTSPVESPHTLTRRLKGQYVKNKTAYRLRLGFGRSLVNTLKGRDNSGDVEIVRIPLAQSAILTFSYSQHCPIGLHQEGTVLTTHHLNDKAPTPTQGRNIRKKQQARAKAGWFWAKTTVQHLMSWLN